MPLSASSLISQSSKGVRNSLRKSLADMARWENKQRRKFQNCEGGSGSQRGAVHWEPCKHSDEVLASDEFFFLLSLLHVDFLASS